ncbi:MAG: DUF2946 family protein [Porticoccaceae bacterium]
MNNYRWIVAAALSLILGLGSVVTSAHSHIDDHIDGSISGNSDHQEGSCSICFQELSAIVDPDSSPTILLIPSAAAPFFSRVKSAQTFSFYLSRAPPSDA